MTPEIPVLLHLFGFALWLGVGAAEGVLLSRLNKTRDWKERALLIRLGVTCNRTLQIPAMLLVVGGGIWLFLSTQQWPPPRWLEIKIHSAVLPLLAAVAGQVYLAKLQAVVIAALKTATPAKEDRFESLMRGYRLTGVIFFVGLIWVLGLAAIRPNW